MDHKQTVKNMKHDFYKWLEEMDAYIIVIVICYLTPTIGMFFSPYPLVGIGLILFPFLFTWVYYLCERYSS